MKIVTIKNSKGEWVKKELYMAEDRLTGQRCFEADGPAHRYELTRDEMMEQRKCPLSNGALREENVLMNFVYDLTKDGDVQPDPNMSLEDWVDEQTDGMYSEAIRPLTW